MKKNMAFAVIFFCAMVSSVVLAQSIEAGVYTGCLGPNGHLYKVAIGDEPMYPCLCFEKQISWNAKGPPGGLLQTYMRTETFYVFDANQNQLFVSTCDEEGDAVLGGGYRFNLGVPSDPAELRVLGSFPRSANGQDMPGWAVELHCDQQNGHTLEIEVYAVCLDLTP